MSVNFEKHKSDLLTAWKEVVDEKTATDWVLLSYEGLSNDLTIVGKGDGGIEELKEELNSGKIMYAFVRVLDPKTSLHKFVLINWQGEGAPVNRKGSCAGHLREIASFFKGTHVTINARNDEEVDEDEIKEKLSKSTGSSYSFKTRTEPVVPVKQPVGAVYKKVIPRQEINSAERDKFWAAEEESEKKRQAEEARIREERQKLAELERHRREMSETANREAKAQSVETLIQDAVRPVAGVIANCNNSVSNNEAEVQKSRNEEAQEVISTRTADTRAIFENASRNNSVTQLVNRSNSKVEVQPTSYVPDSGRLSAGAQDPTPDPLKPPTPAQNGSAAPVGSNDNESAPQTDLSSSAVEPAVETSVNQNEETVEQNNPDKTEATNGQAQSEGGLRAVALYDYQAADETEISFDPGQVITNIDQIDVGWWQGLSPDGTYGLFPANYVELLD